MREEPDCTQPPPPRLLRFICTLPRSPLPSRSPLRPPHEDPEEAAGAAAGTAALPGAAALRSVRRAPPTAERGRATLGTAAPGPGRRGRAGGEEDQADGGAALAPPGRGSRHSRRIAATAAGITTSSYRLAVTRVRACVHAPPLLEFRFQSLPALLSINLVAHGVIN